MKTRLLIIIAIIMSAGCKNGADQADAYGNFEATEVIVSAETSGRILKFDPTEGTEIGKDSEIALIDTIIFHLQKAEINAGMRSIRTRINTINAQNDILYQQIVNLNVNITRLEIC